MVMIMFKRSALRLDNIHFHVVFCNGEGYRIVLGVARASVRFMKKMKIHYEI